MPRRVREQITPCTGLARVGERLDRAGTVERAEDLLTDTPEAPESV
ncbi:hypothetical protein [Streptomyces sp. SID1328]|nr:hypothetical protein [Streptomyces sp. SID1328]